MGTEFRRTRAPAVGPPARSGSARGGVPRDHDAVLQLQSTAGNRATVAALAGLNVQRAPAAGSPNTGGVLELEGFDPIPLQGATWSVKRNVKSLGSDRSRMPDLIPGSREIGDLVLTRQADPQSSGVERLEQLPAIEHGTLRLDRVSRDGALPAVSFTLGGITLTSIARSRDKPALETITLAVGSLSIAGLAKDRPPRDTGTTMRIDHGDQPWPPMAVLSLQGGRVPPSQRGGNAGNGPRDDLASPRVRVKIAAGPALGGLSELMSSGGRFGVVFRKPDGSVDELHDALIERLANASEGPDIVEVWFVAEVSSSRSAPGGSAARN